jgi:hypothetical protein
MSLARWAGLSEMQVVFESPTWMSPAGRSVEIGAPELLGSVDRSAATTEADAPPANVPTKPVTREEVASATQPILLRYLTQERLTR